MGDPYLREGGMTTATICIPFRDRGIDPLRKANLDRIVTHWQLGGYTPTIVTHGRDGDAQFNRSAAYNAGIQACPDTDVFVFTESDMLIDYRQISEAIHAARARTGLVVPFTQYRYLSPSDSTGVRASNLTPGACRPTSVMDNGSSIGAINVVSRATMELIGQWDERFEGNWYDDNAMKIAFELCAGPTRWIDGTVHHLYHLPGWKGDHLTDADRAATAANKARLSRYQAATTAAEIRELTSGAA